MTSILIIAASADMTRMIQSIPGHEVGSVDREQVARLDGGALFGTDAENRPRIVIFGDDLPIGESLSIAQTFDNAFPDIELVLVAEADTDLALRAMRVGIREIMSSRIGEDDLKILLHRSGENASRRLKPHVVSGVANKVDQSRTMVVASPKGGVGKSTIAVNLAVALAKNAPMETVLVDLGGQFGDAATLLNLKPAHTIADAFGSSAALDTLILKTLLTVHPADFYVLCGSESLTFSDKVDAEQVKGLLKQLMDQFRYVIVDTSSGISENTLAALEVANDVIFVSSMDVSSIRALRKEIDVLTELDLVPSSRHLVLNMSDRRSGLTVRDVQEVVGMPVNVVIPRSAEVPISGNLGEPLMLKGKSPVAKAVQNLAVRMQSDLAKGAKKGRKSRRGDPK